MATIVAPPSQLPSRATTPLSPHLTLNTSFASSPEAVPNKHIPECSPGPVPTNAPPSPPVSPPSATSEQIQTSPLHPPNAYPRLSQQPPVYGLTADGLARAVEHLATHPLPDARHVFPWLHGLNAENQFQLTFFNARRKAARKVPLCLRGVTIVKVGGDLSKSRLLGALAEDEILEPAGYLQGQVRTFLDVDPRDGFSVRNFQIQACKMATVSDIVVYADDNTPREQIEQLARALSLAQASWQERIITTEPRPDRYNTFVVIAPFSEIETKYPHLVSIGADSRLTGSVLDFAYQERVEMCQLSKPSEIAPNVWLGPTPDANIADPEVSASAEAHYDLLIEASDLAQMPDAELLNHLTSFLRENTGRVTPARLEFPASGSIAPNAATLKELDGFVAFCKWTHKLTRPRSNGPDGEDGMDVGSSDKDRRPLKILFHCTDGYTETSLFALAYCMFSQGIPADRAFIRLHRDLGRNFFAYTTDKMLVEMMQKRLLRESPALKSRDRCPAFHKARWMDSMDGSLPSRILPYLYLGNLTHAQNPGLLKAIGITQVLSVGEPIRWDEEEKESWGEDSFMFINNVQDNGVDGLTNEFERAMEFIAKAKAQGHATLVHCRVGVSRSATICIAEVMREKAVSFPRAYCFVRARRLNVIVQPHLRFCYELLKWEERQAEKRGIPFRRELEWANIAREIATINKPYCRT